MEKEHRQGERENESQGEDGALGGQASGPWGAVEARLARLVDPREGQGADGWMIAGEGAIGSAAIASRLADAAGKRGMGVVRLDIMGERVARLDGEFADNATPRQLYDKIVAKAELFSKDGFRALAVSGVEHADVGVSNMLRSHLLETPRRFDAVVFCANSSTPRTDAIGKLCHAWGAQEAAPTDSSGAFKAKFHAGAGAA